jgi:hypothetical protein
MALAPDEVPSAMVCQRRMKTPQKCRLKIPQVG